jgi:secreted trypsin-like serine protease
LTKERGTPSDVLKYADVTVMDNKVCKKFEYPVPIVPSMMCQGVDRRSPCQGDSGGPLIAFLGDKQPAIQIGIVSFGPGQCANDQVPNAIYTKTSYHREWIEKTIIENENDKCSARALISPEPIPEEMPD